MTYEVDADARIQALEAHIRVLDALLAERHDPQWERRRVRLERRFDVLWEARETILAVRKLPRCACGKIAHATRPGAEAHRRALGALQLRRHGLPGFLQSGKLRRPLRVYKCMWVTEEVYHVGHLLVQQ